jgi:hypothetical protein
MDKAPNMTNVIPNKDWLFESDYKKLTELSDIYGLNLNYNYDTDQDSDIGVGSITIADY